MTKSDLDAELDRLLGAIEPHAPPPALVARILADAPVPRRASLTSRLKSIFTPQGRRWPAGAALASLALGLTTGYAAAAQGDGFDDPVTELASYDGFVLDAFTFDLGEETP